MKNDRSRGDVGDGGTDASMCTVTYKDTGTLSTETTQENYVKL